MSPENIKEIRDSGAYAFYKKAIESLNEASSESEDGPKTTTDYEHVANFLLSVYREVIKK